MTRWVRTRGSRPWLLTVTPLGSQTELRSNSVVGSPEGASVNSQGWRSPKASKNPWTQLLAAPGDFQGSERNVTDPWKLDIVLRIISRTRLRSSPRHSAGVHRRVAMADV